MLNAGAPLCAAEEPLECRRRVAGYGSDADSGSNAGIGLLELVVRIININSGHNEGIINKSESLSGYVTFIGQVRHYLDEGYDLKDAIEKAIAYCIGKGILVEFLEKNAREVRNMLFTEFNLETAKEVWLEEGREEGREEGIEIGEARGVERKAIDMAKKLLANGFTLEQASEYTELSIEKVAALKDCL